MKRVNAQPLVAHLSFPIWQQAVAKLQAASFVITPLSVHHSDLLAVQHLARPYHPCRTIPRICRKALCHPCNLRKRNCHDLIRHPLLSSSHQFLRHRRPSPLPAAFIREFRHGIPVMNCPFFFRQVTIGLRHYKSFFLRQRSPR